MPIDRPAEGGAVTILDPLTVAGHELPSRVMFGPIVTNLGDGRAFSERHTAFYRERAAGGCGLIVTEDASVHAGDWPYERCPSADLAAPGWAAIAEACVPLGTVVVAGLSHAGGQSTSAFSQREIWAPSDEPDVNTREVPKIMEQADIDDVIAGFGRAAEAAVEAGMQGVEINGGQFSLVRQFLSGLTNRRQDSYGQDRSLFARQVVEAARAGAGADAVVGLRLSCDELAPWAGITPDAAEVLAVELAPLIDYLVVVRGSIFSAAETRPTAHHRPGFNLELAGRIRAALIEAVAPVTVIAQGSIVSVDQADRALAEGQCDAVEMTRAQLADPELVARFRASQPARPCVLCNQLCNVRDNRNPIISCIANPRAGHETVDPPEPPSPPMPPADGPADLLVVGGGPAGLEAARTAARRGLSVELVEAGDRLGGMALTASVAPAHRLLADLVAWWEADARAHGVTIRLGHTVTAEEIADFDGPVLLATGSVPGPPTYRVDPSARVIDVAEVLAALRPPDPQPGRDSDGQNSDSHDPDSLDSERRDNAGVGGIDALLGPASEGDRDLGVVLWDPIGGPIGVAVAELLAGIRSTVSLVTPDAIAGNQLSLTGDLAGSNVRLQQAGVDIIRRQRLRAVSADGLDLVHVFTGEQRRLPADVLIDASARYPRELPPAVDHPHGRDGDRATAVRVGDAVAPRTVAEAVREGRAAAMALPIDTSTGRPPGPGQPGRPVGATP